MDLVKLLIVDDSKTFNNMVGALFQNLGYEVIQAFTIKEAKDKLLEHTIDYIILDLNLSDGDGETLIDYIKQTSHDSKIIVMTADDNIEYRDRIFEKGIIDYFLKTTPIKVIVNSSHAIIQTLQLHKNATVLTIDDSKFVRGFLKNILTSKGYNVVEASCAKEGLELLQSESIDLILLDIIMPDIDGITLLEEIKSNSEYFDIPVIVISADQSRDNYARVLKQGANDFIKKPFVVEDVLLKCDIHIKSYSNQKTIDINRKNLIEHTRYRRSLLEASLDPFIIISKEGKVIDLNTATENMLGYSKDELIDQEFYQHFINPDLIKALHKRVLETGTHQNIPLEIKDIKGKTFDMVCKASSFIDEQYNKSCTFLTLKNR